MPHPTEFATTYCDMRKLWQMAGFRPRHWGNPEVFHAVE